MSQIEPIQNWKLQHYSIINKFTFIGSWCIQALDLFYNGQKNSVVTDIVKINFSPNLKFRSLCSINCYSLLCYEEIPSVDSSIFIPNMSCNQLLKNNWIQIHIMNIHKYIRNVITITLYYKSYWQFLIQKLMLHSFKN